jgi:hypothetical protein
MVHGSDSDPLLRRRALARGCRHHGLPDLQGALRFRLPWTVRLKLQHPGAPTYYILTSNSISTLAALCLDFHVRRNNNKLGMYRLHDIDTKQQQPQQGPSGAPRGPFTDEGHGYGSGGIAEPRDSEAWEAPRPSLGPYSEQGTHSNGYAVPDAQFGYDDTRYYGGHDDRR